MFRGARQEAAPHGPAGAFDRGKGSAVGYSRSHARRQPRTNKRRKGKTAATTPSPVVPVPNWNVRAAYKPVDMATPTTRAPIPPTHITRHPIQGRFGREISPGSMISVHRISHRFARGYMSQRRNGPSSPAHKKLFREIGRA